MQFAHFLYATIQCGGWGHDHRVRDFQRNQFVMVIEGMNKLRKTTGLSTGFAGIRREIAGISRRQFRYVWRNILRGCGAWRELEAGCCTSGCRQSCGGCYTSDGESVGLSVGQQSVQSVGQ